MAQALRYAQQLDVPVAYSTNGRGIVEHDLVRGTERDVDAFATPVELWSAYCRQHGLDTAGARLVEQAFNRRRVDIDGNVIQPRWYQAVAVHRALRAIATGSRRVLLLMATGTGKTFTAMQIVAKLRAYHTAVRPERTFRVLFLADLDMLLTQPMNKDFRPAFGDDPVHRVKGGINTSREIYFASYQAMTGPGDVDTLFADYPEDFFDLVIVDECHRGSAAVDSSWRRVLDHFSTAVQLGLTATPKRDSHIDSYAYFGDPVFEYSLRQGIQDGFLAPFRVRRVVLSPDAEGWTPDPGQLDRFGREIPDGIYSTRDFERVVSLLVRTELAAAHLSAILRKDPTARAMVFCVDQQHAEDMRRALIDANPDLIASDPEWVSRIVGSEPEKARLLEAFTDPESNSPIVATTSRLLSTGVDVEDLKFVVLFRPIGSMVEFKQIIGRGTRLYPSKASTDDDEPETPDEDDTVAEPEPDFQAGDPQGPLPSAGRPETTKLYVDIGEFHVVAEAVQVLDTSTGRLRLTEYGEHVKGVVRSMASSVGDFTARWARSPGRDEIVAQLAAQGIALADLPSDHAASSDVDPLDVLLQVAWNVPARTRAERARRVREAHAAEIGELSAVAQQVLGTLLERYAAHGIGDVTSDEVLSVPPIRGVGSPVEIAKEFGGASGWHDQLDRLQGWLYSA
jgi:type I restriction enzyme R subunit